MLMDHGVPVYFIEAYPERICIDRTKALNREMQKGERFDEKVSATLLSSIKRAKVISLAPVPTEMRQIGAAEIQLEQENDRLRYYHYTHQDNMEVFMFVNEGTSPYHGGIQIGKEGVPFIYDVWENVIRPAIYRVGKYRVIYRYLKDGVLDILVVMEMLPESEQESASQFIKRLVLAWDLDLQK